MKGIEGSLSRIRTILVQHESRLQIPLVQRVVGAVQTAGAPAASANEAPASLSLGRDTKVVGMDDYTAQGLARTNMQRRQQIEQQRGQSRSGAGGARRTDWQQQQQQDPSRPGSRVRQQQYQQHLPYAGLSETYTFDLQADGGGVGVGAVGALQQTRQQRRPSVGTMDDGEWEPGASPAAANSPAGGPSADGSGSGSGSGSGGGARGEALGGVLASGVVRIGPGLDPTAVRRGHVWSHRNGILPIGSDVAALTDDGLWVLGHVLGVRPKAPGARAVVYDVVDDDPGDPATGTAPKRKLYLQPPHRVIPLPSLEEFPVTRRLELVAGEQVLALFPEDGVTAFYKATVVKSARKRRASSYLLRFDDDNEQEREVDARFVVPIPALFTRGYATAGAEGD